MNNLSIKFGLFYSVKVEKEHRHNQQQKKEGN